MYNQKPRIHYRAKSGQKSSEIAQVRTNNVLTYTLAVGAALLSLSTAALFIAKK